MMGEASHIDFKLQVNTFTLYTSRLQIHNNTVLFYIVIVVLQCIIYG